MNEGKIRKKCQRLMRGEVLRVRLKKSIRGERFQLGAKNLREESKCAKK